jgi:hypothetical protein
MLSLIVHQLFAELDVWIHLLTLKVVISTGGSFA